MNEEKLAIQIYEKEGEGGYGMSRKYISLYLKYFEQIDKKKFVVYNFNNFNINYNMNLMGSCPELWNGFEYNDWKDIIIYSRNRNHSSNMVLYQLDNYCDIIFITKYLELDSFDLLLKIEEIENKKKIEILNFFLINTYFLLKNDFEFEDFDGIFFVDIKHFINIKNHFVENNKILKFPQTIEEIKIKISNYIDKIL